MLIVCLVWSFVTFLYLKVAFEATFYNGISVLACLLISVILGFSIFVMSGVYTFFQIRLNKADMRDGMMFNAVRHFLIFAVGAVVYVIINRLIIFGFSSDLSSELRMFKPYNRSVSYHYILFIFISILPLFVHYIMSMMTVHLIGRR